MANNISNTDWERLPVQKKIVTWQIRGKEGWGETNALLNISVIMKTYYISE